MSPPTEQLIRDYLNRLSVAARGQLGPEDRRALVNRTRDFVERKTGFAGPPTAVEVARLLSGLGDPAGLVQQERQRLAAVRGEVPEPAEGRTRLARVLRRDQGKARSASWHWPVQQGSRADLQFTLLDGEPAPAVGEEDGAAAGAILDETAMDGPALDETAPDGTGPDGTVLNGTASNGTAPLLPAQAEEPSWFMRSLGPRGSAAPEPPADLADVADESGTDQSGGSDSISAAESDLAAAAVAPAWQLTMPAEWMISRQARQAARGVMSWYQRCPLEASAVVVLGIGGASYPPLWLLGAALALASRLWDYRDKWVGLALPLLLTLIGTAFGVTRGGHVSVGEGVHEGWVYAVVISRIAAALGASYLAWRTLHGRRPPPVPPWNRPHKIG